MRRASRTSRLAGHWRRAKREGFTLLVRDDARRLGDALRSRRWSRTHRLAPNAVPVFILGIQRSGTEMLVDAFRRCPEIQVYNESPDSPAFTSYSLREDAAVRRLVERSNNRCVVFKALCDSHRALHLIEDLGAPAKGRAIWSFRSMEGRVRSVLAKWPENNRRVLRQIAEGGAELRWEAGGLSAERLDLIRSFDYSEISQASAAALLWYLRNGLFFDLSLNRRDDVALVSYERMLADPEKVMRPICDFLSVSYDERMISHVGARPPATEGVLEIDSAIRARCDELEHLFAAELGAREAASSPVAGAAGA